LISVPRRVKGIDVVASSGHSAHSVSRRFRKPYQSSYGVPEGTLPYFLAYPLVIGDSDSPAPLNAVAEGYGQHSDDGWTAAPSSPAQILSAHKVVATAVQSREFVGPEGEDTITLIFKDGRPPEQIHNYILTRNTLYVGERHHPEIPVDQLDLIATAQVNRDLGVDFHLPGAAK
jgi:hypothetical protein